MEDAWHPSVAIFKVPLTVKEGGVREGFRNEATRVASLVYCAPVFPFVTYPNLVATGEGVGEGVSADPSDTCPGSAQLI